MVVVGCHDTTNPGPGPRLYDQIGDAFLARAGPEGETPTARRVEASDSCCLRLMHQGQDRFGIHIIDSSETLARRENHGSGARLVVLWSHEPVPKDEFFPVHPSYAR